MAVTKKDCENLIHYHSKKAGMNKEEKSVSRMNNLFEKIKRGRFINLEEIIELEKTILVWEDKISIKYGSL